MMKKKRGGKTRQSSGRIESRLKLPTDIATKDISATILSSISKAVQKPFVNELNKWVEADSGRRSRLSSSLSVSIYSDITFHDGESLDGLDIEEEDEAYVSEIQETFP